MTILRIYTDGACSGNQNAKNIGGWGAVLQYGSHEKELFGGEKNTTNNRMEMTALLESFRALKKEGQTIDVFSDSSYLMDCFRKKWYASWVSNGWKTSQKKPVENRDLWTALLPFLELHDISFYRVKGHIDPEKRNADLDAIYEKFTRWNGKAFSFDDFRYITDMNNRADGLANRGIDAVREKDQAL